MDTLSRSAVFEMRGPESPAAGRTGIPDGRETVVVLAPEKDPRAPKPTPGE